MDQHIIPEILDQARQGNLDAKNQLADAMTSYMLRVAMRLLTGSRKAKDRPEEMATELVEDVLHKHESKNPLRTWEDAKRVLWKRAIWRVQDLDKELTRVTLSSGHAPRDSGFSSRQGARLDLEWLRSQVELWKNKRERQLLRWVLEDVRVADVAGRLGIEQGAAGQLIRRAKSAFVEHHRKRQLRRLDEDARRPAEGRP